MLCSFRDVYANAAFKSPGEYGVLHQFTAGIAASPLAEIGDFLNLSHNLMLSAMINT